MREIGNIYDEQKSEIKWCIEKKNYEDMVDECMSVCVFGLVCVCVCVCVCVYKDISEIDTLLRSKKKRL